MIGVGTLKALIPHRFPVLLVDRVLEVAPGDRIVSLKAVTCNEPWYQELPDDTEDAGYAYPTALVIESWCQSAALLAAWDQPRDVAEAQVALFGGISGIQVHGAVLPGEVLRHEVRITRALEGTWFFEGTSRTADGRGIITVESVMTALRPSSVLDPAAQVPA
ncbi:beta-hydroxyacyl-ACP dehydratase [Streptomyces sp. NPDC006733]|uniref:3-hydroxyacyl-ACP dehydratase FabZ family protein n=1 Tax=Streptomyces sp. NPDC006733 TaxID=3155460 RepID=UPI0033CCEE13